MSSTGTETVRSQFFRDGGATISTGAEPARNCATSSLGSTVADSPIRWAGLGSSASSRSSDTARCAPRLVPATAWTSSTMIVSTSLRVSRALDVSIRKSDSGVVMRISGGWLSSERRSDAVVSPDRTPTVMSGAGRSRRLAVCVMPISGARRLRSTSTPRALSGDMYSTRVLRWGALPRAGFRRPPLAAGSRPGRASGSAGAETSNRSSAQRNAASVLPEPVGATTRACAPEEMAFQAPFWAGVGAEKAPRNQSRVGRLNRSMASAASVPPASSCPFIPPSCPTPPTLLAGPHHGAAGPIVAPAGSRGGPGAPGRTGAQTRWSRDAGDGCYLGWKAPMVSRLISVLVQASSCCGMNSDAVSLGG